MTNIVTPGAFVLASILTSYPDSNFSDSITELLKDENIFLPLTLRIQLEDFCNNEQQIEDLRSEYISTFDQSKSLNPLYETEYGRERAMFKANELSDISGFYKAFGFELDPEAGREMFDHISVELEFYSLLLMKHLYLQECKDLEGCSIIYDGMKKFMDSHLGRFVPAILERDGVKNSIFYKDAFEWIKEIISLECSRLEIKPEIATWFSSQAEGENMCCGGTVGINK